MKRYILDTNIISELARKQPNSGVVNFMASTPRLSMSVIVFHELTYGLNSAPGPQKYHLTQFLARMRERFGATSIPVDLTISETAGRLRSFAKSQGRVLSIADSLMAATALIKDAELVTRNIKDFEGLDIPLLNPFS
jgi:toxin FitB